MDVKQNLEQTKLELIAFMLIEINCKLYTRRRNNIRKRRERERNVNDVRGKVPRDTHRYLIEIISLCLHVKTMLAGRCVSFYETIEASLKLCIRFLSNLCKNDLNTVLGRNLFSIANDCSVNPSDLGKMLVKKHEIF